MRMAALFFSASNFSAGSVRCRSGGRRDGNCHRKHRSGSMELPFRLGAIFPTPGFDHARIRRRAQLRVDSLGTANEYPSARI